MVLPRTRPSELISRRTRRSTSETLEANYVRPNNGIYFTDQYEKVPYLVGSEVDTHILNYWFTTFFPYLLSLFCRSYTFNQFLLMWLIDTRLGRSLLNQAINLLEEKHLGKHSQLGCTISKRAKSRISIVAMGTAWIRTGISIGKYIKFKKFIHHYDPKKAIPSGDDIKGFSGSIRNWLTKTSSFKIISDANKSYYTISNGVRFLMDAFRVFVKENLIYNAQVFLKYSWDSRVAVQSTPTILTVSLAGYNNSIENCITLSAFKTDEKVALQHTGAWKCMQDMLQLSSMHFENKLYSITHIVSPDLCALRASVNLNQIQEPVRKVWMYQQAALVLEMCFNGQDYSELLVNPCNFQLRERLMYWRSQVYNSTFFTQFDCGTISIPIQMVGNIYRLKHLPSIPSCADDFSRRYWIDQHLCYLLFNNLNPEFHATSGNTLTTCPFCFYSWKMRKFYFKFQDLKIWRWKRTDDHWKNCIGYSLKNTGICIAHGLNRIMYTMLSLTIGSNEDDMKFFAALFNTGSIDQRFLNKKLMKPFIRSDLLLYYNELVWTNNGIKVKEINPQNQARNNGVGSTKTEFNQLLFKMTDKIVVTFDVWFPIMQKYFEERNRANSTSIISRLIAQMQQQQNIAERPKLDEHIRQLWRRFQDVWKLCHDDRHVWNVYKANNYTLPRLVLTTFHQVMSNNVGESADGIADYVHIICFHLIDLFEKFGLAPWEYHNIDSEALHSHQKTTENATSLKGGCFHDETEDLLVMDLKKFFCRLGDDSFLSDIYENNKASSYR